MDQARALRALAKRQIRKPHRIDVFVWNPLEARLLLSFAAALESSSFRVGVVSTEEIGSAFQKSCKVDMLNLQAYKSSLENEYDFVFLLHDPRKQDHEKIEDLLLFVAESVQEVVERYTLLKRLQPKKVYAVGVCDPMQTWEARALTNVREAASRFLSLDVTLLGTVSQKESETTAGPFFKSIRTFTEKVQSL
ncbi:hypothetical protein [Shouchella shacheensis]|uniref:hypothetical protein n=1 Tax=Shouchella shacheensis TaxID=1649580 RepID=UPI00073FBD21|nr:hypothetical protein [Shouchella shacheensis]